MPQLGSTWLGTLAARFSSGNFSSNSSLVVRHSELNQQIADKKAHHFLVLDQFLDFLFMTWIGIRIHILMSSKVILRSLYVLIIIILQKIDKGCSSGKNKSWIFVQNPMQMYLLQFKLNSLDRIWIHISVQESRNWSKLENGMLSYSIWKLVIPLDGAYLPHLIIPCLGEKRCGPIKKVYIFLSLSKDLVQSLIESDLNF